MKATLNKKLKPSINMRTVGIGDGQWCYEADVETASGNRFTLESSHLSNGCRYGEQPASREECDAALEELYARAEEYGTEYE